MTPVDLCNQALGLIGQGSILSLDSEEDESQNANKCRLFYETERDAALRDHEWNFAIVREVLATTTAPVSGFIYAFARNAADLRVLSINDDPDAIYQIEGRNIVTDETTVTARYIRKVEDPTEWDALFASAFSLRLASKLALAIAHDANFAVKLMEMYAVMIGGAQAVDGQESTREPYQTNDLIVVRNS